MTLKQTIILLATTADGVISNKHRFLLRERLREMQGHIHMVLCGEEDEALITLRDLLDDHSSQPVRNSKSFDPGQISKKIRKLEEGLTTVEEVATIANPALEKQRTAALRSIKAQQSLSGANDSILVITKSLAANFIAYSLCPSETVRNAYKLEPGKIGIIQEGGTDSFMQIIPYTNQKKVA